MCVHTYTKLVTTRTLGMFVGGDNRAGVAEALEA